jgi:hypothetical protein
MTVFGFVFSVFCKKQRFELGQNVAAGFSLRHRVLTCRPRGISTQMKFVKSFIINKLHCS